jgi:tetraacyldisaccharide 4'-kinase
MRKLRLLLLPFGSLYGIVAILRNWLYTRKILKSEAIPVASICVGNLSTGGTGKTPLVDYLISHFEARQKKVATLSRGYGRKTTGARIAVDNDGAGEIGDEPAMYRARHPKLTVAVAERRVEGVKILLKAQPDTELILLDDAFQHRAVQAGLSLLVTEYSRPFFKDYMLPAGNLREPRIGRRRADAVVVSKCPNLNETEKQNFTRALKMGSKPVFFARIAYDELVGFEPQTVKQNPKNVLLITGIGNPESLVTHLEKSYRVSHMNFPDHHVYTAQDIQRIHEKFDNFASLDKIIVTTEKDAMRIRGIHTLSDYAEYWFFQPIQIEIEKENEFIHLLDNYVDKN